jgi:hypothetical protein
LLGEFFFDPLRDESNDRFPTTEGAMTNTHGDGAAEKALRVIEKSTREELEMLLEMPDEIFHEMLDELRKAEVRRLQGGTLNG